MTDLDTLYMREVAKPYEQPPEMSIWKLLPGMLLGACVWAVGWLLVRAVRMIW